MKRSICGSKLSGLHSSGVRESPLDRGDLPDPIGLMRKDLEKRRVQQRHRFAAQRVDDLPGSR